MNIPLILYDASETKKTCECTMLNALWVDRMNAYSNRNLLHTIKAKQFIDSPEFESSNSGDEKFQVGLSDLQVLRNYRHRRTDTQTRIHAFTHAHRQTDRQADIHT